MKPVAMIVAMCAAEVMTMLGTFSFPALQPEFTREWELSGTAAGWINGIYFGVYAVGVPVLASLTDRIDGRRVYAFGAALIALSWGAFALFADGFVCAMLFRGLAGLGLAGTFLPGLKALLDRLPESAQSRAIAFYTATFSLGTSLSFFASGWLAQMGGWRAVFWSAAGSGCISLILAVTALGAPARPAVIADRRVLDFRPVFRNRASMGFVLAYAAHIWELFAYRSWIVAFLSFAVVASDTAPGLWTPATVAAITGLVAMWASVAGEEFAQRLGRQRALTIIMLASAAFGACLGFTAALPYPLVVFLCILYALLVQGDSAALHAGAIMNADPSHRGATMAFQSLLGFSAASVSPIAIGVVLDGSGGAESVRAWGLAFIATSIVVASGPWFLRRFSAPVSRTK